MPFIDLSQTDSQTSSTAPTTNPVSSGPLDASDNQVEFHSDGVRVLSGPPLPEVTAPATAPADQAAIAQPAATDQPAQLPVRSSNATPLAEVEEMPVQEQPATAVVPETPAPAVSAEPLPPTATVEQPVVQPPVEHLEVQDVLDRELPQLPPQTQIEALEREVEAMQAGIAPSTAGIEGSTDLTGQEYSLDNLLEQTVKLGASDLHLTAGYRAMARVDGKLQAIRSQMLTHDTIKAMVMPIIQRYPEVDAEKDRDMDLAYELSEGTRFRVNIGYQQQTMTATFRLIPSVIKSPQELHLPALVTQFTKYKQGLVLVTGPTGSGKSTTLAALINEINKAEAKHIITIEDPIEYAYPKASALVDQRNVGVDTMSWPMALRAALRQDPDVVLIGEMRDIETMEAALQVAETGHLVFSTLHTNTAAQTIDRVIDAFPKGKQEQVRTQLATVLMAVISQRLIPIAGGGRRLAVEVMVVTSAIRNAIREGKVFQIDNMIQTGAEFGMITLEKSLAQLVRDGLISVEVAQQQANKPEDILSILGRA